jgi:hypothetical protein
MADTFGAWGSFLRLLEWYTSAMHPEAVQALVAMGEYTGTQEAFMRESVTAVQVALGCSPETADRTFHDLINHRVIDFEITQGGELPTAMAIPTARWYWYVLPAA